MFTCQRVDSPIWVIDALYMSHNVRLYIAWTQVRKEPTNESQGQYFVFGEQCAE